MRGLSDHFMDDLLKPEGRLRPILKRVQKDHTLMLAIRDGYINIYYRGGNILRITEDNGFYQTFFDIKYAKTGQIISTPEEDIRTSFDADKMVACLSERKTIMDNYFADGSKTTEREFQQLVARENNNSSISNESEYFITDIEVTVPYLARFDITAIRWPANQRKKGSACRAALIEMKYGDGALTNDAGLMKHLNDMDKILSDKQQYTDLSRTMETQFNQLDELGLLNYNKGTSQAKVTLNPESKPEVIFILANHNPRSTKLKKILCSPELSKFEKSANFDLRFFVANFAGYGLHAKCMLPLAEFRNLC